MGDAVWDERAPRRSGHPVPQSPEAGHVYRVTSESDGPFAPRMMSDRANAWVSGRLAVVFAGSKQTGGARFFQVDLATEQVAARSDLAAPYGGETEFWYWTPDGRLMIGSGLRLHRVDPISGSDAVVMDASFIPAAHIIDQWHSSDDGLTHSATVKDAAYRKIGTVTMHNGTQDYWPAVGDLDESQVRRDGAGVFIKENRGYGDDNRYIDFDTRETTWLTDQDRAVQHSDCGPDYVVGEADRPDPGGCVVWHLDRLNEAPRFLFPSTNMGYVSTRAGKCLWSNDVNLSLVALDGSGVQLLIEHGANVHPGDYEYYNRRVKANMDHTGQVAVYMVEESVYLVRIA